MKLNNRGFAITGIVYSLLVLFLIVIMLVLGILSNRKIMLNKVRDNTLEYVNSKIETTNYTYLRPRFNATTGSATVSNDFLGATLDVNSIQNITFTDQLRAEESIDVSLNKDGTVLMYVVPNGNKVKNDQNVDIDANDIYIYSNATILAPRDSSSLFESLKNVNTINFNNMFNTMYAVYMRNMFKSLGSSVQTGSFTLDLGNQFYTYNAKYIESMFENTGVNAYTSIILGPNFDTSAVSEMTSMFSNTGSNSMTLLDLGPKFTYIPTNNYNMFNSTGKANCIIKVPSAIYYDSTHFKLNTDPALTIEYTRGTLQSAY